MSLFVDATLFEWYAHVWIDINVDHKPFIVTVRFAVNDWLVGESQDSAAAVHKKKDSNWLTGRFSDVISESVSPWETNVNAINNINVQIEALSSTIDVKLPETLSEVLGPWKSGP